MKKKLLSLVMGICMVFIGMFSLSGCSVVRTNDALKNQKTSIKVGDTTLTRADIVNAFYTYYQNNVKPKPETAGKKGFVCKVCGYVYEGETLPEDIVCPLCKHGASDFEPIA